MAFVHSKWLKKTIGTTLAATCALTLMPTFADAASENGVTTANVNLRKGATTASVSQGIIAKGSMIDIIGHEGKWYEVKVDGKTGYIRSDYVSKLEANRVLKEGVRGDDVTYLQQALKELGYFKVDVTGYFGSHTAEAVKAFQRAQGLTVDGKAGDKTWAKLQAVAGGVNSAASYSSLREGSSGDAVRELQRLLKSAGFLTGSVDGKFGAQTEKAVKALQDKYGLAVDGIAGPVTMNKLSELSKEQATSTNLLKVGSSGAAVKKLQQALKEKGFYKKNCDGEFGQGTLAAVKAFQIKNGLKADGIAGPATLGKLYATGGDSSDSSNTQTDTKPAANGVQLLEWSKVKKMISSREVITVYDVNSGKSYKVRQLASGNHCDVEPLTAEDTAIIKQINGGKFTWTPRPVWISFDGNTIAASIHSMPHDVSNIKDNNFDGHVCMHFLGSKTHNGNAAYTQDHQDAVQKAWAAAKK